MKVGAKDIFKVFKTAAVDWMNDHAPRLGAALAFYTIFSLAPLLTMLISIAALWFSDNASQQIFHELGGIIGADNAAGLQKMLVQSGKESKGWFTAISSGVMLVVGATGVFVQLQDSLNEIWEVKPKPGQGIMGFIRHRLLSFAMVLAIAFLLLVSLLLTTALAAAGKFFSHMFGNADWLWQIVNFVVSFGLITLLFAMMFKYVPDAKVAWKDVWVGAVVTSLLFSIGKFGLGLYLGKSSLADTYSGAGALIVTLLWVYYTAQIVFFGAEMTQAYAHEYGRGVVPSEHAEKDHAKEMASAEAERDRERKKAAKGRSSASPAHSPAPAYAMRQAEVHPRGRLSKALGGALVVVLALIPVEKKFFGRAKI
jgi:membrane protein